MLNKFIVFWISCLVAGLTASVAPFIEPCTPLDSKCIVKSAKIALPYFAEGVEELGIIPIEPLVIKDVVADTGDLKLTFTNITIEHLSQCTFVSIVRDPVKSTGNLTVECPIIIKGNYTLGGQLFFIDIQGDDEFEISDGVMRVSVNLRLKEYKDKEDKNHYKISGFDYTFEPISKFNITFENLFGGDKEKAEPIDKILNESWKELILDVGKPVIKQAVIQLVQIINKFFHSVPNEDLEIT